MKHITNQFLKFGIIGIFNSLLSYTAYCILIYFNINFVYANTIGFIISVLNSYFWNGRYVFKRKFSMRSILSVFISYGITLILNNLFLILMISYFNISKYIAPIINIIVITPINYLFVKLWVFK